MKKIIVFFLCLASSQTLFSQTIKFTSNKDTILYVPLKEQSSFGLTIKCDGCNAKSSVGYLVKRVEGSRLSSEAYSDANNHGTVTEKSPEGIFYITLKPTRDDHYKKDLIYFLFDSSDLAKVVDTFRLRLEKQKINTDVNHYRLLIGSNFDFIDGVDLRSAYYHLQFFVPKGFSNNFGFVGGIQRNRQVSFSDTLDSKQKLSSSLVSFRLNNFSTRDSLFEITQVDSPQFKRTVTGNALMIYFQPTVKIFSFFNDRVTPTQLYLFAHLDMLYKKTTTVEEYTYTNQRQKLVKLDSLGKYRVIPDKNKTEASSYQYDYGAGIMLHHDNKDVELYAKIMLGWANTGHKVWHTYYGTEIGVRVKAINVMLGAEYRGLSIFHQPDYLNVYLSKVFPLEKLIDKIL